MTAAPANQTAPLKALADIKVCITVTWPENAEAPVLGKTPLDEIKAAEVIAAAKKFGAVTGFAMIGKKKFTF